MKPETRVHGPPAASFLTPANFWQRYFPFHAATWTLNPGERGSARWQNKFSCCYLVRKTRVCCEEREGGRTAAATGIALFFHISSGRTATLLLCVVFRCMPFYTVRTQERCYDIPRVLAYLCVPCSIRNAPQCWWCAPCVAVRRLWSYETHNFHCLRSSTKYKIFIFCFITKRMYTLSTPVATHPE